MNHTDHARMMGRLDACLEAEPHRTFDDHEQQRAYREGFRYMAARLESRAVVRKDFADEFPYADAPGGWGAKLVDAGTAAAGDDCDDTDAPRLMDYHTAEDIRAATDEEIKASREASPEGVILLAADGTILRADDAGADQARRVYVAE